MIMMTDVANVYQPDDRVGLSPSFGQHSHHTLLSTGDFDHDHRREYDDNFLIDQKFIINVKMCL